jgi:hypothetical protein
MPSMGGWGPVTHKLQPRSSFRMNPRDVKNLKEKMQRSVQKALDKGTVLLRKESKWIKAYSQSIVPERTGNLKESAHYKVRRQKFSVVADIWYDDDKAWYAWVQHEVQEWSHAEGRRYKYLLEPMLIREDEMENIWAKAFEGVFK